MADTDIVDTEQLAALERAMADRDAVPQWKPHLPVLVVGDPLCRACGLAEAAKLHHHVDDAIAIERVPIADGATFAADPETGAHVMARQAISRAEAEQRYPGPPPPLASFVEAGAVDMRLTVVQNELAQLRGMLHHVMVLVMVMGDRQKISAQEYDAAAVLIAKAEKDGPR